METNTLRDALVDVERWFCHLEFAIRVMCHCEIGELDLESCDTPVTIELDPENVELPPGAFGTVADTVLAAQAQVGVALGVSAIVLDAAFDVAGVSRRPHSRDDHNELRLLVYMVRCAFAHNPAYPVWEVRGPYSRDLSFAVGRASATVDLAVQSDVQVPAVGSQSAGLNASVEGSRTDIANVEATGAAS